ncbi:hypothetical protein D9758_014037 [Tetrapyrgos nigripes]|uniref:ATP-dependent DNA helicase n=1 Tax=Tetrapyrgos nigripes TaxID=182062 RepID=A0A8H5CXQ9_9AGAR|nr:hypothetical protein D9758_014037 [Tetrapyrgos nigripes]
MSDTHELVLISNNFPSEPWKERVPNIIGQGIPRQGTNMPLLTTSLDSEFESYQLSPFALRIIVNWEAIYECEDERDFERLRRQYEKTKKRTELFQSMHHMFDDSDNDVQSGTNPKQAHQQYNSLIKNLQLCQWLTAPNYCLDINSDNIQPTNTALPSLRKKNIEAWTASYKSAASTKASLRHAASDPSSQVYVPNANTSSDLNTDFNSARTYDPSQLPPLPPQTELIQGTENSPNSAMSPFERYIFRTDGELQKDPLRMFLTGPGGTGKTHVVNSVKEVMKMYGKDHCIRYLAPTGRAASLIDGMTIHKGLGIKIRSKEKGKGNRKLGENEEDYSVCINVKKREQLRQEWKDVALLFIDEVSLMDAGLFAEIDAALRFATENYDEYFGGIFLVVAGDFNQLPPVGGSPLCKPICSNPSSESQAEIKRRIGRMAWKRFDTVITLMEQNCMSSDPEYGAAVLWLRSRNCTQEDVDLFNSRRIKSWNHLSGLQLSEKKHYDASAIVATNLKRQVLNQCKTEAICTAPSGPSLIECFAYDEATEISTKSTANQPKQKFLAKDAQEPGFHIHAELIKLNFSSQQSQILPGSIQCYIGMPVILKSFNLCTELGVTNGSMGFLRHIDLKTCQSGFTYATAALVEFPDSSVSIPGLPDKWFPIVAQSSTFTVTINDENGVPRKLKCFRKQLPLQSSATITAHFAQGQTMDPVLASFKDGPAAAYVSASRATHRSGLFLLEEIKLQDLNTPKLSLDLCHEYQRLDALEHNTLVQWNFLTADTVSVPDIEGEHLPISLQIKFSVEQNNIPTKRKRSQSNPPCPSSLRQPSQKLDIQQKTEIPQSSLFLSPTSNHISNMPGCVWDSQNWSCAYDTALTLFTYIYREATPEFQEKW